MTNPKHFVCIGRPTNCSSRRARIHAAQLWRWASKIEGESVIEGECFCGTVRYQIDGRLVNARSCHCSRCRKAFSGASSAYAELADTESFKWVSGENNLQHYIGEAPLLAAQRQRYTAEER